MTYRSHHLFHTERLWAASCMLWFSRDIAFVVSRVAKFTSNPRNSHWTAVKRIFRYLFGAINTGISYYGTPQDFTLCRYCDTDYAGDHDDWKSRTGYLFILAHGAIACAASAKAAQPTQELKPSL